MSVIGAALDEGDKPEHHGAGFDMRIVTRTGREYEGPVSKTKQQYVYLIELRESTDEEGHMRGIYIHESSVESAELIW